MKTHLAQRHLAWFVFVVIGTLLLSSCGGAATAPATATAPASATAAVSAQQPTAAAPASTDTQPTTAPAASQSSGAASGGEPITIVHWQHQFTAREKIVQELAQEFEAANPNIKIDFQSIPYNDYFQKIGPSLEAGSGPDVFQIPGPLVREFYGRGQLTPVPEDVYTGSDIEKDFVPWTVQLLKQEGKYVGLPTDVQPFLVFYNDDLFKAAGLDPSKDLETWEDVTNAADKLTKRDGDTLMQAGISVATNTYQWYWAMISTLSDKGVVDENTLKVTYDNDQGVAGWRWLTELVTKHKVDSPEFLKDQDKFALGKAAIDAHEYTYSGNLKLTAPDLHYSVHLPPHAPGRAKATVGTHWSYVVSSQSKHPSEAWAWIKFLTSEQAERKWIAGGAEAPARTALYSDQSLRSDPTVAAAMDAMKVAVPFDDFGWDDVYNIQQGIWENVVLKGQDVQASVHEAAQAEEKLYQDKKLKPTP